MAETKPFIQVAGTRYDLDPGAEPLPDVAQRVQAAMASPDASTVTIAALGPNGEAMTLFVRGDHIDALGLKRDTPKPSEPS
jgi:hypothetical protein